MSNDNLESYRMYKIEILYGKEKLIESKWYVKKKPRLKVNFLIVLPKNRHSNKLNNYSTIFLSRYFPQKLMMLFDSLPFMYKQRTGI